MEKFNFRSMDYFLKTAETLNFTKAAEQLYISQPALSRCIRDLENEIGVRLFERTTRQTRLTPGGRYLYGKWSEIRKMTEESLTEARKMNGIEAQKVRIGIVEFGGVIDDFTRVIDEFNDTHQDIIVEVSIYGFEDLRQKLQDHTLDLVITLDSELPQQENAVHSWPIRELNLYIYLSEKNHFYNRKALAFHELKDENFCIFSDRYSESAKNMILEHCHKEGFTPRQIRYYPNMQTMEYALEHSDAVTIAYDVFFHETTRLKRFPITGLVSYHLVAGWIGDLKRNQTIFLDEIRNAVSLFDCPE